MHTGRSADPGGGPMVPAPSCPLVSTGQATILVVDDQAANRELLAGYLADSPCVVQEAADGEHALALATAAPPDLIILDVLIPGLDGYTVTARLKRGPRTATIP